MQTAHTLSSTRSAGERVASRQVARSQLLILLAAVISFGHENQGIFVGLWVPSILSFGSLMLSGRRSESQA